MYTIRMPHPGLRAFIENYWFVFAADGKSADLRVEVFADARPDLVFNFGVPYRRTVIGGESQTVGVSNLDAQRLVPIRIEQHGAVRVLGVRFRLGGLSPFSQVELAGVSGRTVDPETVLGSAAAVLTERLRGEHDPDAGAGLLDAFLLELLDRAPAATAFRTALAALEGGLTDIGRVAADAGVSPRQLERLFAKHLGFPPKTVARVLRFQRALTALMAAPQISLGELAIASGYFDQAHFIRDFRTFTGGVPRGYRGYYPPEAPTDFAPNVVVFVQDEPRSVPAH